MVLVFDFGLGQRGLLDDAPHHRLRAAIERAVLGEFHDLAGDLRLGRKGHRLIGMVPVADDAETLEFLPLHIDPMRGEGAALAAELDDRHLVLVLALGAIFFLDLPFDGQAVTVPARHVVRILARHLLRTGDEIFQDLVEGVPNVNIAVGVGGAVVEEEFRPPLPGFTLALIKPDLAPARE